MACRAGSVVGKYEWTGPIVGIVDCEVKKKKNAIIECNVYNMR